MLAAKLPRLETVEVVEEPIPKPGKGEVLIQMKASALCRSDLHRYHGTQIFDEDESACYITPGHEPCGVVAELGEGVTKVKVGDRVALYLGLGCGVCPHCLRGDVMLCKKFRCIGFAVNGAHADYMTIPEENCLPMPDEMDYITGALSTDVGGTLYTACKRLGLNGTKSVVIIGCGPMGSGGILMAKGFGAKVIAVDTDEKRLAMARELGADETLNPMKVDGVAEPKSKPFTYVDDEYAERAIRCSRTYYEYAKDICENYRMDLRRYKLIRERKQYIGISNREAYQAMCEDLAFAQQSLKTVLNDYADLFRKRFSEGLSIRKAADAMQQNRGVIERRQAALYRAFAQLLQQRDEADGVCRLMQKTEYDQRDIEDLLE